MGIRAFDPGSRRSSGFQLRKALSLGPGVFIGLLRWSGLSRPRVKHEVKRCRPSSENLKLRSASKMTGVGRRADISDRVLGRLDWADSAPTRAAAGRTAVHAIAIIPLRALTRPSRSVPAERAGTPIDGPRLLIP